eukprot:m.267380 g.267380  ORF g.267380 m.267380 type:complete len:111 (+) comp54716_c1_seq23:322-654(+)
MDLSQLNVSSSCGNTMSSGSVSARMLCTATQELTNQPNTKNSSNTLNSEPPANKHQHHPTYNTHSPLCLCLSVSYTHTSTHTVCQSVWSKNQPSTKLTKLVLLATNTESA